MASGCAIFLESEEVGDSFATNFMGDLPHNERVLQYADYLTENYISEEARFPPKLWAANTSCMSRTTNACESFHSKFNTYCGSPHPNIHVFIKALMSMQIDTYIKINSAESVRFVRSNTKQCQNFIEEKIIQYRSQQISRYNFVKCISYKYNSIML